MKHLHIILLLFISQWIFAQENIALIDAEIPYSSKNKTIGRHLSPFQIKEGMMLVKAYKDNQLGNYIIDTGAPVLVINSTAKEGFKTKAQGISETLLTREINVKKFNWSGIKLNDIAAYTVDISHLETASRQKIAGIIGYDILKDYELNIDYDRQYLELLPAKKQKKHKKEPIAVIPFVMQAHLPVIKVKIGDKKFKLAIDTGSEVNVLHNEFRPAISDKLIKNSFKEEIQGVDQKVELVEAANIKHTKVKDIYFKNMKYVFTDLSHLKTHSNLNIDGLLGYPFLKNNKFSINYRQRKIYVWD